MRTCVIAGLVAGWFGVLTPNLGIAAAIDFVSANGDFNIAGGRIDFGNGLLISSARTDAGTQDEAAAGLIVALDDILLVGSAMDVGGGVFSVGFDPSLDYRIRIFDPDTGMLLLEASYDPQSVLVVTSSVVISSEITTSLSNLQLSAGVEHPSLIDLSEASGLDLNLTLSSAGQNIMQRIQSGGLAFGSVAGSLGTIQPDVVAEPSSALLLMLAGFCTVPLFRKRSHVAR